MQLIKHEVINHDLKMPFTCNDCSKGFYKLNDI